MKERYSLEIAFLVLVITLSLTGFSSLITGERAAPSAYHLLHVATSFGWLLLLLAQLVLVRQRRFNLHRTIGTSIFLAGPLLVASLALLAVHSAAKDAVAGRADVMVVQNVTVAVEVALLVLLAFFLRRNRAVHGALLLGTALLFLGIALFFTLTNFVPGYRIEGPHTFHRFAMAAETSAYACGAIGLLFFLKDRRTGWPWLLAGSLFFCNGFVQALVARGGNTRPLTDVVAAIGRAPAFVLGLAVFFALLWLAWKFPASRLQPARQGTAIRAGAAAGDQGSA